VSIWSLRIAGRSSRGRSTRRPLALIQRIGGEDDVVAERGSVTTLPPPPPALKPSWKKRSLSVSHRQAAGPTGHIAEAIHRIENPPGSPPGSGWPFVISGDHAGSANWPAGRHEIPGGRQSLPLLPQLQQADALFIGGDLTILRPHNLFRGCDGVRFAVGGCRY